MGRGPTAYFLFTDEHRATAKAEVLAASTDGKAGVAQVAKLIGQKWAALSDEEKQAYKERAQQLQAEAAAEAAAASPGGEPGGGAAGEGAPTSAAPPPPFGFPTSLVKRIILMDEEVGRVSADAVRAVSKAAELFVGQLAARALEHAAASKKKNFKAADVVHVAGRDKRLQDMGLRQVLQDAAAAAAAAAAGGDDGSPQENGAAAPRGEKKSAKRQKQEAAAAGTRNITAFFGAAAAAPQPPAAAAAVEAS